ncbi:hypothetical protein NDU88_001510 [Pleurodeles waltl]|uniref:Uncharacterized protein n=1 Tax=Pleurodeles waltl TaxID=8319 RepID=A0AAV7THY8_PLEWA|nr:hypothetical protein NDU88_001510 [Pleurodeles waltl]
MMERVDKVILIDGLVINRAFIDEALIAANDDLYGVVIVSVDDVTVVIVTVIDNSVFNGKVVVVKNLKAVLGFVNSSEEDFGVYTIDFTGVDSSGLAVCEIFFFFHLFQRVFDRLVVSLL